jgi:hypothetical protein
MQISSNTLGDLGRALKLSSPSPQENTLVLPPTVQLILDPRAVADTGFGASGGVSTAVLNSTWAGSILGSVTNAGAATFLGSFCAAGIWELSWHATYFANFVQNGGLGLAGMQNGAATKVLPVFNCWAPVANSFYSNTGKTILSFSESFQPFCLVPNAGAAQTNTISFSWILQKLIL